jgi:hypothetical protein
VWQGPAAPPEELFGYHDDAYYQLVGRVLGLSCRGKRVAVTAMFMKLSCGNDTRDTRVQACQRGGCVKLVSEGLGRQLASQVSELDSAGRPTSARVRRCALQLPREYGDDMAAAMRANVHPKEVNCTTCASCRSAMACPLQVSRWYSGASLFAGLRNPRRLLLPA